MHGHSRKYTAGIRSSAVIAPGGAPAHTKARQSSDNVVVQSTTEPAPCDRGGGRGISSSHEKGWRDIVCEVGRKVCSHEWRWSQKFPAQRARLANVRWHPRTVIAGTGALLPGAKVLSSATIARCVPRTRDLHVVRLAQAHVDPGTLQRSLLHALDDSSTAARAVLQPVCNRVLDWLLQLNQRSVTAIACSLVTFVYAHQLWMKTFHHSSCHESVTPAGRSCMGI